MNTPSVIDCLRIASKAINTNLVSGDINDIVTQECASMLIGAVTSLAPYVLDEHEIEEAITTQVLQTRKFLPINSALTREDRIAVVRTIVRIVNAEIIQNTARM